MFGNVFYWIKWQMVAALNLTYINVYAAIANRTLAKWYHKQKKA